MLNGQGLILSAPASGSGKTTLTLGILRALSRRHENIRSAKSGPDYIDPRFHAAASGRACLNLDAWAMTPARLADLASGPGTLMIEGAMGLFDGAPPDGRGATADLARHLGLPVILILDCARQSHSMAAVVEGFAAHRSDVKICGLILNNTGSERHEAMLHHALSPLGLPVLGAIRRMPGLAHPSRHLGLVQADERPDLQVFLDPYYINAYAYKLQHLPYGLLWVVRLVMLTTVVVHIWVSVVLTLENMKARPHDYKVKATVKASYASRTMRVSGVILFLFIVFHIAHFTVRNVPGHEYGEAIKLANGDVYHAEIVLKKPESQGGAALKTATGEDKIGHDVHTMIIAGFQVWWISAFYVLAVFLLSQHLSHGVSSLFQSLGLRNSGIQGSGLGGCRLRLGGVSRIRLDSGRSVARVGKGSGHSHRRLNSG